MDLRPIGTVTASAAGYLTILACAESFGHSDIRRNVKAISSLHATCSTALGIYALASDWEITKESSHGLLRGPKLDDSNNPLIFGESSWGNLATAVETGYLLFDTLAMLMVSHRSAQAKDLTGRFATIHRLATREPAILCHHLGLLAGLSCLQSYIAHGTERGVRIIVALILMNASTPLLHLRWWRRQRTGKPSLILDMLLATAFATCRLGSVAWVLKAYGDFHGISSWEAISQQRLICQAGTFALLGLNSMWLYNLLQNIVSTHSSRKPAVHD